MYVATKVSCTWSSYLDVSLYINLHTSGSDVFREIIHFGKNDAIKIVKASQKRDEERSKCCKRDILDSTMGVF